jgi:dipeptidyl aminopeptidase/acylaminoacyl peptidase
VITGLLLAAACGSGAGGGGGGAGGGAAGPVVKSIAAPTGFSFDAPRFSPDGLRLAVNYRGSSSDELSLIPLGDVAAITRLADAGTYLATPAWSGDGAQIFFTHGAGISKVPSGGGAVTLVSGDFNARSAFHLEVARDGSKAVYKVNGGGLYQLALTPAVGTPVELPFTGSSPRLSPDGTRVAYVEATKFKTALLDGGEAKDLGGKADFLAGIAWFEDGKTLAVVSEDGVELIPIDNPAGKKLLRSEFAATGIDLSRDGKLIVYRINGRPGLELLSGFSR